MRTWNTLLPPKPPTETTRQRAYLKASRVGDAVYGWAVVEIAQASKIPITRVDEIIKGTTDVSLKEIAKLEVGLSISITEIPMFTDDHQPTE